MIAVRRDRQLTARLITAVLGAVLLFAPWAFGFVGSVATWSAWGLGFFLVALGVVTAAEPVRWPDRLLLAVGVLVIAAPWALGFASEGVAIACHAFVGIAVIASVAAHLSQIDRVTLPAWRGLRRRPVAHPVRP
jgi:hypothetical protein